MKLWCSLAGALGVAADWIVAKMRRHGRASALPLTTRQMTTQSMPKPSISRQPYKHNITTFVSYDVASVAAAANGTCNPPTTRSFKCASAR